MNESSRRNAPHGGSTAYWFAMILLATTSPLSAADFLRGDANGDGAVTISDAHTLTGYMFFGAPAPECPNSGDSNADGRIDISDTVGLMNFLFLGGQSIPAPYPNAGPDPNPLGLPCPSYGDGSPLVDPAAKMEISGVAGGGNSRKAVLTLKVSSSGPLGGYAFNLADAAGVFEEQRLSKTAGLRELALEGDHAFLTGESKEGIVRVGFLGGIANDPGEIPPGQDVDVLEVFTCLKPGTPAGEYPLTLQAGELVASCIPPVGPNGEYLGTACPDMGRAIHPILVSGTLVVQEAVEAGAGCSIAVPPKPAPIHILFKLSDATGTPGGPVSVPFVIKADRASTGFSYSVDFNEEILQATGTRKLWQKPGGTPYEFERFEFNNSSAIPGSGGVDEGFLAGAAIISLTDTGDVLPPSQEVEVIEFDFQVRPNAAAPATTEIVFMDGAQQAGGSVNNKLIAGGVEVTPALASSFVFVNAQVNIVPGVTVFVRGDSDSSGEVNISDPVYTLNYLYQGGRAPFCLDAADANDDGTLDLSDPVATLAFLFLGGSPLPDPGGTLGKDPTENDSLTCFSESR